MARFADYLESGYLPGEVRRASYEDASPFSILQYELNKRLKFKPQSNYAGKYMKEFSALSENPNYLVDATVQLPADFTGMMNFLSQSR